MPPTIQIWLPPLLSMLGSMIVVVFAAWLNTRVLSAQIDSLRSELKAEIAALRTEMRAEIAALRAEMKQGFAELRLEFHKDLSALTNRVERMEETGQRGIFRP